MKPQHFSNIVMTRAERRSYLEEQILFLQASAKELREEGVKDITVERMIARTLQHRPYEPLQREMFKYDGRSLAVDEDAFEAWYGDHSGKEREEPAGRMSPGRTPRVAAIIRR